MFIYLFVTNRLSTRTRKENPGSEQTIEIITLGKKERERIKQWKYLDKAFINFRKTNISLKLLRYSYQYIKYSRSSKWHFFNFKIGLKNFIM